MRKKKSMQWSRLDNAAKIFPPTSNKSDTKVFRFICELHEAIDVEILQRALNINMEMFPMFNSILKRGFFWYYLETSEIKPIAKQESKLPCSPIYDKNIKNLLFNVTYFGKRINFEVYHALTDGTGALQFLRVLVYNYLIIKHSSEFNGSLPVMDYDVSDTQKTDDSFLKYYNGRKKSPKKRVDTAYRLRGLKNSEGRMKIIEGILSSKKVLDKAREYNVSVTGLLGAMFLLAIYENMHVRHRKKPVVITVPVNLRNFFVSRSERNFFGIVNIAYNFCDNPTDLKSIAEYINGYLKNELKPDKLEERMSSLLALERNVLMRAIPLVFKDIVLKIANGVQKREFTVSLSNVGKVEMPSELKKYIKLFDIFISTNKLQICMCSFEENMSISFTSSFSSTEIQKNFFRILTSMGIGVEIVSNQV